VILQDLGFVKNIQSVLGNNPLLWLWPQQVQSDGLSYPVSKTAHGEFDQPGGQDWQNVVGSSRRTPEVEVDLAEEDEEGRSFSRREREGLLRSREGVEEV
jgi:hypothetical protein